MALHNSFFKSAPIHSAAQVGKMGLADRASLILYPVPVSARHAGTQQKWSLPEKSAPIFVPDFNHTFSASTWFISEGPRSLRMVRAFHIR